MFVHSTESELEDKLVPQVWYCCDALDRVVFIRKVMEVGGTLD